MGFIKTVWRGDAGLAMTYWVWGTLIALLIGAASFPLLSAQSAFLFVLYFAFVILYWIWVSVGVWRSAGKYQGKRIWATLARLGVIVGAVRSVIELGPLLGTSFS